MHDLKSPQIQELLAYRSPVGVALVERGGRFVDSNAAYCALVGYSSVELERRTWQSITHPDDLSADQAEADDLSASRGSGGYGITKRYIRKDGRTVWCELTVVPVRDEQGVCTHLLSFAVPLPESSHGYRVEQGEDTLSLRPVVRLRDYLRDNPREAILAGGILVAMIKGESILSVIAEYASKMIHP